MNLARLGFVSIAASLICSGCVTEGGSERQPASTQEQLQVNLALGVGYLREDRPDLAVEALQRAIALDPRSADAQSAIAIGYDQQGKVEQAEEHHRRATQLAPRDADIQNAYAVFLCRQNRWSDADPYFQKAVEDSDRNDRIPILVNAASCARGASDLDGVERNLRAVLDIDAVNVVALRGMMDVAIRTSNFISGRAFWQRLERVAQVQPDDLLGCYVIERQLGDTPAAQTCADRLSREFPNSPALTQLRQLERNAG